MIITEDHNLLDKNNCQVAMVNQAGEYSWRKRNAIARCQNECYNSARAAAMKVTWHWVALEIFSKKKQNMTLTRRVSVDKLLRFMQLKVVVQTLRSTWLGNRSESWMSYIFSLCAPPAPQYQMKMQSVDRFYFTKMAQTTLEFTIKFHFIWRLKLGLILWTNI